MFSAAGLTAIALDPRRHLRVPSRDLDVERKIPKTLGAGGSFTRVWQTVPRSPSYLFVIEEESTHDQVDGILDLAVDKSKVAPIADVAASHGDCRLATGGTCRLNKQRQSGPRRRHAETPRLLGARF